MSQVTLCETIHNDDMGPVIGSFKDNPVRSWDNLECLVREKRDSDFRVGVLKDKPSITAEVLPGELICEDSIIRRETAASERPSLPIEEQLKSKGMSFTRMSIEKAKQLLDEGTHIIWRPNGSIPGAEHYALVIQ